MQSPARSRAWLLLVGLLLGTALVLLIAADAAQAASCSGSIAPVSRTIGARQINTVNLQFSCDQAIGGNSSNLVLHASFSGPEVDLLSSDQLQCDSSDVGEFDCQSDSGSAIAAGTTISLTPSDEEGAVCSPNVTISVFGSDPTAPLAVFKPTNSCAGGTKQTATLTVKLAGTGSGRVTSRRGDCSAGPCSDIYPVGSMIPLTAVADSGSTFAGWSGGGCTGTGTGTCTVTIAGDTAVTATFTKNGGTQPTGTLRATVDRGVKVSGSSVTFTLGCHAPSGKSCAVLATLTTTEHLRSGKVIAVSSAKRVSTSKKVVTLATVSIRISAGAKKTVTLSLGKAGRNLLARFHKLPARVTASLTNAAKKPIVIVSKTVTFTPQKKPRGR